jgi:hypothetical protein
MNRILPLIALGVVLALPPVATSATSSTPQQTVRHLRAQLASSKALVAKQKKQIAALIVQRDSYNDQLKTATAGLTATQTALGGMTADRDAKATALATANATIGGLQAQVAAQAAGGAAAVIAGGPNAMWAAVIQIWTAFPMQPPSGYCGYDKSNSISGGTGLNFAHYDFENVTNC